jgi:hypothetical protein
MREEKLGSELGRLLATAGWLLGGKALGLSVHESLTTTSETAWLQEEVTRLRRALAEESCGGAAVDTLGGPGSAPGS